MSLKEEIKPYIDGNGLVAPELVAAGVQRASDNGVLFTSEYYIMLHDNNELTAGDIISYSNLILSCVGKDGYLHRAPGDETQDEIDDHVGAFAAHYVLGLKPTFGIPFKLWRFPQLLFLWFRAKLQVHWLIDIVLFPLTLITTLIIAISSYNAPLSDVDSRTLAWLLIRSTDDSWLCKQASKIWFNRLRNDYGAPNSMREVAKRYFKDNHPFTRYWED